MNKISIESIMLKVSRKLIKNDNLFWRDINKDKEFLNKFPKPKDDVERAYFQYRCQNNLYGICYSVLANIVALPMIVVYCTKYYKRHYASNNQLNKMDKCSIFFRNDMPISILPDEYIRQFDNVIFYPESGNLLVIKDLSFLKDIWKRYPFSWHFVFKILLKMSRYRFAIELYQPDSIVTCNEYSFTSSILTLYCENMGIEHFNVMHGEKLFNIRDSFFRYSKCYVWDEFYIDLFKKLRAEPSQFIVNVPKSINFSDMKNIDKQYDYTYYLGAETGDVLKKIVDSLQKLSSRGYKVCVRPHPRYTNLSELINLLDEKNIVQESNNFEIEESVMKTRNAVSCYSTVLNQAYHSCVSIVIDDISNPVAYEKLKELDYVMLNVEHRKLSEILEET